MAMHSFRSLAHPLSQIQAAEEIYENASAYVQDMWESIYKDPPPTLEEVDEWLNPFEILGYLSACQLRFELAGTYPASEEFGDGYWTSRFSASTMDILLHSWLFQFKDELDIDPRVVDKAFMDTDLILVPDPDGITDTAYGLILQSMQVAEDVKSRVKAEEELSKRNHRRTSVVRAAKGLRGEGPRTNNLVLADRAALALRDAGRPLSADEVAKILAVKNIASINTTLHQMSAKRRPKRLAGWVQHLSDGRYEWIAIRNQPNDD
ncbi:hypothetical protein LXT21_13020 [Myxococcus sp. K38C18041901]|uniref:hypothetical protein n=1 Tax=Myxococcus guangdongensis TaxID=2906760 RepID=UPI0020A73755|nr:hypothetical protein [Myxococcus guangdongensis]MCP3059702.1 hypothetical protein [Myxococcus guangdongensis]